MFKRALTLLILSFFSLGLIAADPVTIKYPDDDPNFSMTFPDGWTLKQKEDGYYSFANGDSTIYMDFWAIQDVKDNGDVNLDELSKDMDTWLKDVKMGRAKANDFSVNGIQFTAYTGTAKTKDGDTDQDIEADLCTVDGKTAYVIMYYGDKGAATSQAADIRFIFNSIRKVNP